MVFEEGDFALPRVASRRRREQPRSWQVSMGGKIVDRQLAEKVKALRNEGKTQEQIAVELRIGQSTVSVILQRDGLGGHLTSARRLER
jgi:DNA-binding NarL/FixJ family response regulator